LHKPVTSAVAWQAKAELVKYSGRSLKIVTKQAY